MDGGFDSSYTVEYDVGESLSCGSGNCAGTKKGETVIRKGVKLIGASDLPCSVPNHASSLYARNLIALIEPFIKDGEMILNLEDELIAGCLISYQGAIRCPDVLNEGGAN